jgi:peptidoglycan/LPS O-acetylase OafA/YrhL
MSKAVQHVPGLDTIRLLCALIVALGHFSPAVDLTWLGLSSGQSRIVSGALFSVLNGQAAVIVFFVLSGFVIHLPTVAGKSMGVAEFYARRWTRVGIPSIAFVVLYLTLLGPPPKGEWNETVLWSIFCELAYYALYPWLLRSGIALRHWLMVATAGMLIVMIADWDMMASNGNYQVFGAELTWIVGFPVWLMGCLLAEYHQRAPLLKASWIWLIRLGLLVLAGVLLLARYHSPLPPQYTAFPVSLTLFSVLAVIWLAIETRAFLARGSSPMLDRLGATTFSLYLSHWFVLQQFGDNRLPPMLLLYCLGIAAAAALFYYTIEYPSHLLARTLGGKLRARSLHSH